MFVAKIFLMKDITLMRNHVILFYISNINSHLYRVHFRINILIIGRGVIKGGDEGDISPPPLLRSTNYFILYKYYISAIYSLCSIIISNNDLYCATQHKSIILNPL